MAVNGTDSRTDARSRHLSGSRTIVLADDHEVVMLGLIAALEARGGLVVVDTAANGIDAVARVRRHRPDLAIFDDAMPGMTGLEAFLEARRWSLSTRFVILTGLISPRRVDELMTAGIDGVILKSTGGKSVCEGIEAVLRGEKVVSAGVADTKAAPGGGERLTAREREVLECIARGLSSAGTAEALGISVKTIETHRSTLMRKLEAKNVATMLVRAIRLGLIDV